MASSSAAGAGSTDPTAARRNTKRPKCIALEISLIVTLAIFSSIFSDPFVFSVEFFGLWWKFLIFLIWVGLSDVGKKRVLGIWHFVKANIHFVKASAVHFGVCWFNGRVQCSWIVVLIRDCDSLLFWRELHQFRLWINFIEWLNDKFILYNFMLGLWTAHPTDLTTILLFLLIFGIPTEYWAD